MNLLQICCLMGNKDLEPVKRKLGGIWGNNDD